jgi:hypothetical protein
VTFVLDWPNKGSVSLVVLDELTLTRDELDPRFLLHTMSAPAIDGKVITATHGAGRLTATVLLPQSPRIEAIGGPGREFEVEGTNYPLNRTLNDRYNAGAWRAEISGGSGTSRQFLTLLVPADVEAPAEPGATVEESASGWIVRQGDLAIALSRRGRRVETDAPRTIRIELAE